LFRLSTHYSRVGPNDNGRCDTSFSIIATQLHQAFRPQTAPISEFGLLVLRVPEILVPLAVAAVIGIASGLVGEKLLPSRAAR